MNPSIPAVAVTGRRSDLTSRVTRLLRSNVLALVGAILLVAAAIAAPALLTASNLGNMLLQFAPLGIVVIGQMLVILVRGLDLSVASVMATSAVVATSFSGLDHGR